MMILIFSIIALSISVCIGIPAFGMALYAVIKIKGKENSKHEVHLIRDNEMFKEDKDVKEKMEEMHEYNNEFYSDINMPNPGYERY